MKIRENESIWRKISQPRSTFGSGGPRQREPFGENTKVESVQFFPNRLKLKVNEKAREISFVVGIEDPSLRKRVFDAFENGLKRDSQPSVANVGDWEL